MSVTLSGGDLGGTVVQWQSEQAEMTFSGYTYRLNSDNQTASFIGMKAES